MAAAALLAFYKRHPRYAGRPFFIFGESFAGHMAPNIAWRLLQLKEQHAQHEQHEQRSDAAGEVAGAAADVPQFPINLQGLAIGDGWVDPIAQNEAFPEVSTDHGTSAS
jgi:carboxypeptidase C (cathepsin A)